MLGQFENLAGSLKASIAPAAGERVVSDHLRQRRARSRFFSEGLFGEAAWDILLDLYLSEVRGKAVSITSACIAAAVPPTTALRSLKVLENGGLVERQGDPGDGRRIFVRLTEAGRGGIEGWLAAVLR